MQIKELFWMQLKKSAVWRSTEHHGMDNRIKARPKNCLVKKMKCNWDMASQVSGALAWKIFLLNHVKL